MLLKQKNPSLPRNLAHATFGELAYSVLIKAKSAIPPLFMVQRNCLLHHMRKICLLKTFMIALILMI